MLIRNLTVTKPSSSPLNFGILEDEYNVTGAEDGGVIFQAPKLFGKSDKVLQFEYNLLNANDSSCYFKIGMETGVETIVLDNKYFLSNNSVFNLNTVDSEVAEKFTGIFTIELIINTQIFQIVWDKGTVTEGSFKIKIFFK